MMSTMPFESRQHRVGIRRARRWISRALIVLLMSTVGLAALAARPGDEDDADKMDGRLDGYAVNVRMDKNGTALGWMLFSFMGVLAVASLFKNAKRTHLD